MATKLGRNKVTRVLDLSEPIRSRKGYRSPVVRITAEGVYIKLEKERWSSAYVVSWRAIYDMGGKIRAQKLIRERKEARLAKKQALAEALGFKRKVA